MGGCRTSPVAVNYQSLIPAAEVSAAGMAVVQRVVKDIGDAFTDVEKQFLNHSFSSLW
jgi:hypothetical protein